METAISISEGDSDSADEFCEVKGSPLKILAGAKYR